MLMVVLVSGGYLFVAPVVPAPGGAPSCTLRHRRPPWLLLQPWFCARRRTTLWRNSDSASSACDAGGLLAGWTASSATPAPPRVLLRQQPLYPETDGAAGYDYAIDDQPFATEQQDNGAQEMDYTGDDYYTTAGACYYVESADAQE